MIYKKLGLSWLVSPHNTIAQPGDVWPGDVVANFTAVRVGEAQHSDAVAISALCAMVMSWPRLSAPCGGHSEGTVLCHSRDVCLIWERGHVPCVTLASMRGLVCET